MRLDILDSWTGDESYNNPNDSNNQTWMKVGVSKLASSKLTMQFNPQWPQ